MSSGSQLLNSTLCAGRAATAEGPFKLHKPPPPLLLVVMCA